MTRWETLEEWLYDHDVAGSDFSQAEYVADTDIDAAQGTADIQYYLKAQRSPQSRTLYVLRRQPGTRTCNARWAVGIKTSDARKIGSALFDDTRRKVRRAFVPDLARLRTLNPRASRLVEAQIDAVLESALRILEVAVMGQHRDDDDEGMAA